MHKDVWYYVDRQGKQRGPVTRAVLSDAIAEEAVIGSSLVWRDGMAQWQPLSSLMSEFEDAFPPAPPSPPAPPTFAAPVRDIQHPSENIVYAGFARRAAAMLLDWVILCVATFVIAFILSLIVIIAGGGMKPGTNVTLAINALVLLLSLLYFALQESSVHQATLGKRALGIKVVNYEGKRLGFAQAAGRWFASTLSYLTLMVGFLMAAFTGRKQALHDVVAGTLVVDRFAYTDEPERQKHHTSALLIILAILGCSVFPLALLAAIAVPAYQDYVVRSNVVRAMAAAEPVKALVAKAYKAEHRCPANGESGIAAATAYARDNVASISTGSMGDGGEPCAVEITLNLPNQQALHGKQIWLEMPVSDKPGHDKAWACSANVPDRYLPVMCRAPNTSQVPQRE
ncbi:MULTISPECIES: RDD family protein [Dyella]|uniref:DUF4339 domain-containing protein n=2 Tax=Dyella TaxID=231454 RepID=A0A4R0Z0E9_9GAMM|nr:MULTISPECIES: RDD family protein [Dyella]TBR39184.1 DUF4339 domain-containing protein [Dyella terrae]TCI13229.1 DUF4339 domain-containing protein [Dyella soli]